MFRAIWKKSVLLALTTPGKPYFGNSILDFITEELNMAFSNQFSLGIYLTE